ncbi:MAG: ATP phosphoribosyltransferase [Rikenellaceae bacterium]|jgi:ATP phosphoribosyltransferase|nr:ATP phosphoribosyltransferase [Rikenellaceae bacterium]
MLRIAIQTKGRLNEDSTELLSDAGVKINSSKRKFLTQAENFPIEILYLRDDDIPQTVASGLADIGIVGLNEVEEKGLKVDILQKLGFGGCRLSLALPKDEPYNGPSFLAGKTIATSYPNILRRYMNEQGVECKIAEISGSVEIAPAAGLADAIFDIVSSGGTLVSNGLAEVEKVLFSEAVLIGTPGMDAEKKAVVEELMFRFESVIDSRGKKYILMNIPTDAVDQAVQIIPAMRSPTIMPLAQEGWCSMHSVVEEKDIWNKIKALKEIGAEGILVLSLEKMIR